MAATVSGSKAVLISGDSDMANLLVDLSPIVVGWIVLRVIQISPSSSVKLQMANRNTSIRGTIEKSISAVAR
jgi:hypothetical protein